MIRSVLLVCGLVAAILLGLPESLAEDEDTDRLPAQFTQKRFSINLRDTEVRDVLRFLGVQGGVRIVVDDAIKGKVSYTLSDMTLDQALEKITTDQKLVYIEENGSIYVSPDGPTEGTAASHSPVGKANVYRIEVINASAQSIVEKLPKSLLKGGESLIIDEETNGLVFHGSEVTNRKLKEFISVFDQVPLQILIEGQIVETSKNFARDIGFSWGLGGTQLSSAQPSAANIAGKLIFGKIGERNLEATLLAAESEGDAKIISRPKVVTLNNKQATIHSGITLHVKTLSNTTTQAAGGTTGGGTGEDGGTTSIAGGLRAVSAGFNLTVQPLVVGKELVKLMVSVSNSEPNFGLAVDGIPGIVDNTANTSIIIRDGTTAVMAGLVKSSLSRSESRVPWIARIPLIGLLFGSHSNKDVRNELMIFLTPRILTGPVEATANFGPEKASVETPVNISK